MPLCSGLRSGKGAPTAWAAYGALASTLAPVGCTSWRSPGPAPLSPAPLSPAAPFVVGQQNPCTAGIRAHDQ